MYALGETSSKNSEMWKECKKKFICKHSTKLLFIIFIFLMLARLEICHCNASGRMYLKYIALKFRMKNSYIFRFIIPAIYLFMSLFESHSGIVFDEIVVTINIYYFDNNLLYVIH